MCEYSYDFFPSWICLWVSLNMEWSFGLFWLGTMSQNLFLKKLVLVKWFFDLAYPVTSLNLSCLCRNNKVLLLQFYPYLLKIPHSLLLSYFWNAILSWSYLHLFQFLSTLTISLYYCWITPFTWLLNSILILWSHLDSLSSSLAFYLCPGHYVREHFTQNSVFCFMTS